MTFFDILNDWIIPIILAAITALVSIIGEKIRKIYKEKVDTEQKQKVIEICVKAAEQLYQDSNGTEKLKAVKHSVVEMLNAKDIVISEIEMDMLIESVVAELNFHDLKITKPRNVEAVETEIDEIENVEAVG